MSKTREALERAERERIARKEQQQVPIKKPAAKKSVYVILAIFTLMIFGLFSFWAGSTGYLNRITDVAKKNSGGIAAKDPPANVQSHVITSEEIFGVQVLDFYQDTIQQLEVLSRSEQSAIPIPQKLNNTNRTKDRKSKSSGQNSVAAVISETPPVKEKDKSPDPDALIDWVLKKRSMKNE
jgi:hypothetical protein